MAGRFWPKAVGCAPLDTISACCEIGRPRLSSRELRMKIRPSGIALLVAVCVWLSSVAAGAPQLVKGTFLEGSNLTEPRPVESEYLRTVHGGVVVAGDVVGFYLIVKFKKALSTELFARIRYEDPLGGPDAENTGNLVPGMEGAAFSSPGNVDGLEVYQDYTVTVSLYESEDSETPFDVLVQTIRSYVQNKDGVTKVFDGIEEYSPDDR